MASGGSHQREKVHFATGNEEVISSLFEHKEAKQGIDAATVRVSPWVCTSPFAIDLGGALACYSQLVPGGKYDRWVRRIVDAAPRPHSHSRRQRIEPVCVCK